MKALQLGVGVLVLALAVAGYFFYMDAAPEPQAPESAVDLDEPAEKPAAKEKAVTKTKRPGFMPMDRELSDEDPEGELMLEGQVLSADDLPVEGATVSVSARPPRKKVTGKDGTFAFDEMVARRYRLTARTGDKVAGPVVHELSDKSQPVILRLRAGAGVEVTVLSAADAKPIAGAVVELRSVENRSASTDAKGVARLEGVESGHVSLAAWASGYAPAHKLISVPDNAKQAVPVKVLLQSGAQVGGQVVDGSGQPVEGARVLADKVSRLLNMANAEKDGALTDAEGRFLMTALAGGRYRFIATHKAHPASTSEEVVIDGKRPRHDIRIVLAEGGRIAGRVEDQAGQGVPYASVRLARSDLNPFSGSLTGPRRRGAIADGQGNFEIQGLPRTKLVILARGEEASSPGLDVDLSSQAVVEDLVLRLEVDGRIGGQVKTSSGEPVAEVQVIATPDIFAGRFDAKRRLGGRAMAMTDGGGNFVLKGLSEGSYELRASRSGGGRRAFLKAGVKAKTGDEDVQLVLDRDGAVKGRVVYASGGSPASFTVTMSFPPGVPVDSADGSFEIPGVAPGDYEVIIRGEDFADTRVPGVQVQAETTKDLGTIEVSAGRSLRGRVVDDQGKPVAGALVIAGTRLVGDGSQLTLDLGSAAKENMGQRQTRSEVDGSYHLGGLGQERYLVIAEHEHLGRSRVEILEANRPARDLDLVLQGLGELTGLVTSNGKPVEGGMVSVVPQGESDQQFVVNVGADGSYRFEKLAAGSYRLTAVMSSGGMSHKTAGKMVQVESGQKTQADIDIPVGEVKLSVQVTGVDGAQVDTAQVLLIKGQVQVTTAGELGQVAASVGGNMQAGFWTPQMAASFSGVVPGDYSLCVIPINGNLMDPAFGQKLQKHKNLLKVYCSALAIPAAPAEQSHAVAVPAMEPLPE